MAFCKVSAVLFDLDGTLVHSAPDMAAAANWLRAQQGLPEVDVQHLSRYVSRGAAGVIGAAFPDVDDRRREALITAFLKRYGENVCRHSHVFAGVPQLLSTLKTHAWPWGVVTNKAAVYAEPLLDALGLREDCSALICGDTLAVRKPQPDGLLEACRRMKVAPEHCVYVGDDQRDIQAARAAGCPAVAAAYGYFALDDLPESWGADAMIQQADELLKVLGLVSGAELNSGTAA
ncbi:MAG: phosphoglycolate phosphatase [Lysobacterales bacterium]